MASAPAKVERVAAFEGTLSLPTYGLTGQNRNPVFRSLLSDPRGRVCRTLTDTDVP